MNSYTVTIKDTDTLIERSVMVIASSPKEAHKDAMFYQINDFDVETVTTITDQIGDVVFTERGGFTEDEYINNNDERYERQD